MPWPMVMFASEMWWVEGHLGSNDWRWDEINLQCDNEPGIYSRRSCLGQLSEFEIVKRQRELELENLPLSSLATS